MEGLNRLLDENGISRSDVVLEVCERCYDIDVSMLGMIIELLSKCSFMKISINLIKGY